MLIISDFPDYYIEQFDSSPIFWKHVNKDIDAIPIKYQIIFRRLLEAKELDYIEKNDDLFDYALITDYNRESQFKLLNDLISEEPLDANFYCFAGKGEKFVGFHGRSWESLEGNIHLVIHLVPNMALANSFAGFMVMAAVSALETCDENSEIEGLAMLKWVNDIYIENSKVAGILVHTRSQGEIITEVVIGIGFNVERNPNVKMDLHNSESGALNEFLMNKTDFQTQLEILLDKIKKNYKLLLEGHYDLLYEKYISHSMILNKEVEISFDKPNEQNIIGNVNKIGKNLELYIDGQNEALYSGRIINIY